MSRVVFSNRPNGDEERWLSDLKGIYIETVSRNIHRKGIENFLGWLETSDFYTAVASSRFHSSIKGGLVYHTLAVYETLKTLVTTFGYQEKYSEETIAIVALLHDLCKVNTYKVQMRNRKNDITKQWESYPFWIIEDRVPLGHGEKSLFMAQNFIKLSIEEALAIRWHMLWSNEPVTNPSINGALNFSPLVLLTANADHMASIFYEYDENKSFETQPLSLEAYSPVTRP